MNKIAIYVLLVLIYLGLAKGFSSNEMGIAFIKNSKGLSSLLNGNNLTAVLIDTHSTGYFIKTYYQKYRVISVPVSSQEIIVRTSRKFALKNINNIGLSLFRRYSSEDYEDTTPLPPGMIFVGDPQFGRWKYAPSGRKEWNFYPAYKELSSKLGWGKFKPSRKFYDVARDYIGQNKAYYGLSSEFGTEGEITKTNFIDYFERLNRPEIGVRDIIIEYFKKNF
jgi:hypothetical protein